MRYATRRQASNKGLITQLYIERAPPGAHYPAGSIRAYRQRQEVAFTAALLSSKDFSAAGKLYPAYAAALASLYKRIDDIQLPHMANAAAIIFQNIGLNGWAIVTNSLLTEFWAWGEAEWIQ